MFNQEDDNYLAAILREWPVIPLIGIEQSDLFSPLIDGCLEAAQGQRIPAIEILLRDESRIDEGLKVVAELKKIYGEKIRILIGSVINTDDVSKARDCGADALVAGGYSKNVAQAANTSRLPYLYGCMSLEDVQSAYSRGDHVIKLFPASSPTVQAIMAPLGRTQIEFLSSEENNAPHCSTPTDVLSVYENDGTEVNLNPIRTQDEFFEILKFMERNRMQACCTGGIKLGNISEFASFKSITGVGASFIVSSALDDQSDFSKYVAKTMTVLNQQWSDVKERP